MMNLKEMKAVQKELYRFVEYFRPEIGRSERRRCCGQYLSGLLLDGERKSIEPLSSRVGADVQSLSQFVNQSPWAFEPMQSKLRDYMLNRFKKETEDGYLILDDTSFPKKGKKSIGVSHQYCGTLGKQANCQSMVSWQFASPKIHFPLQAELYLPKSWTEDVKRMKASGVPERRFAFQEKWRLALDLLDQFRKDVAHECILCDAGYGQSKDFLRELDKRNECFIAQIPASMNFWSADVVTTKNHFKTGRPAEFETVKDGKIKPKQAQILASLLVQDTSNWKKVVLPHKKRKTIEVTAIRVKESNNDYYRKPGKERWLLIEKFGDGFKYYLSNLPKNEAIRKLAVSAHARWKIEQGYQQLKEELGMDHFEGRSWLGFHHHVTLSFMAYDFLLLLRKNFSKKKPLFPNSQFPAYAATSIL